jgi:HAD superfamily hydrolase (TIGR01509 family)
MDKRPLIVFDAMGVIFRDSDDVASCLEPFLESRGVNGRGTEIKAVYRQASLGSISAKCFWERFGLGKEYPAIQDEYLRTRLRFDPGFRTAARALSGEFDIAMLSNDLGEWSEALRRIHGIEEFFSFAVISSDARARKPDPAIYRALLSKAGRSPALCLMVDDRLANLEAARGLGMRTALFLPSEKASSEWAMADSGFKPDIVVADMPRLAASALALFA